MDDRQTWRKISEKDAKWFKEKCDAYRKLPAFKEEQARHKARHSADSDETTVKLNEECYLFWLKQLTSVEWDRVYNVYINCFASAEELDQQIEVTRFSNIRVIQQNSKTEL